MMFSDGFLGGCSGDVAEAVTFAREIATDWQQRVSLRLDGGRTTGESRLLLWSVYASEAAQ